MLCKFIAVCHKIYSCRYFGNFLIHKLAVTEKWFTFCNSGIVYFHPIGVQPPHVHTIANPVTRPPICYWHDQKCGTHMSARPPLNISPKLLKSRRSDWGRYEKCPPKNSIDRGIFSHESIFVRGQHQRNFSLLTQQSKLDLDWPQNNVRPTVKKLSRRLSNNGWISSCRVIYPNCHCQSLWKVQVVIQFIICWIDTFKKTPHIFWEIYK